MYEKTPTASCHHYKGQDQHRQAVAACVAQIGTPLARQVLQRGARSRRATVQKTCASALARFGKS